jgi:hypothetical protein
MELEVTMCGYLDDVVPIDVQYRRNTLRRYSYLMYWVEPIDRYGYQTSASQARARVEPRRFWTMQAAERHAREAAQTIRERVAREADYYELPAAS